MATVLISLILCAGLAAADSTARIKDIAFIQGVRSNQLVGYGLVAGLDGTGDGRRVPFTRQMLANMVNQFGVSFDPRQLRAENVAAVMVTAELPPYAKEGMRIDATVSTINAESLRGGTLMLTPLQGVDNKVYALAQGAVSVGGGTETRFRRRGQERHLTTGVVPGGALVETEVSSTIVSDEAYLTLCLNHPDFTTSSRIMEAINLHFHQICAKAADAGTVKIKIPDKYGNDRVTFISEIESIPVETDTVAKVVINERTSTIVVGQDIVITPVAVSHGDIRIIIGAPPEEEMTEAPVAEGHVAQISGANVGEVAAALNDLGVSPQDMIAIFQAIERAGALQAQLQLM
jgi:flagellar P-ring protein precursor FlgI